MKIKVIDLLVKISKGEKPPKHIKCNNLNLYWNDENYTYDIIEKGTLYAPFYIFDYSELNDNIEIIEEPKKIEKIEMVGCNVRVPVLNNELVGTDTPLALETTIVKINELIDEINKLKEK